MQALSTVQQCLTPLATAFCLPSKNVAFTRGIERLLAGGEHAVSVVFPHIRDALAHGAGAYDPQEMEALSGVIGTGVTLLKVLLSRRSASIAPLRRAKLRALLGAYRDMLEDIEMFASDITAADCFRATSFPDLETPAEDAAWRDL